MKKLVLTGFLIAAVCSFGFAKELEGTDLLALSAVLDAKLDVGAYEELSDQLAYVESIEKKIADYGNSISDEAKMICKSTLILQKETLKAEYLAEQEKNQKNKSKKEKDPEKEAMLMKLFEEYKGFADSHSDLSSYFYFHYKELEFSTLAYLPLSKQIELLKNIVNDYKKIEEINPDNGENLLTYSMMLYMAPKIAGGDKVAAREKILRAIDVSTTRYERATSNIIYSQYLVEEKQKDEAAKYFEAGRNLGPAIKKYDDIKLMNDAGYSMFQAEDYEKRKK